MSDERPFGSPAEAYQAFMVPTMFQPWSVELLDRVHLVPGERVLDVACGTGVVARGAAMRVGPDGEVTGIDISQAMLDVARGVPIDGGSHIEWKQAHAEELPFEEDTFDVVLCQQGLQFFNDREAGVREMYRVLKVDGRVGVSVWRGPEHQSVKGALVIALIRRFGPGAGMPYSFGDPDALRALFVDSEFSNVGIDLVRRQADAPSADELITMTIMGASAAVPTLANATTDERMAAIRSIHEEIASEIGAVQVGERLSYVMESHILTASASY